jgi:Mg/Co/Ni transporter MgtE
MTLKEQSTEEFLQYHQDEFESALAAAIIGENSSVAKNIIKSAHIADLASFLNKATALQKSKTLKLLDEQQISELIIELDISVIPVIVEMMGAKKIAKVMDLIDIDDAIYVLDS